MTAASSSKNTSWAVEAHNVTVAYQKLVVLWEVSFQLPQGKLIGIIGPNGAGKSTLLKAIMGLVPVRMGSINVLGSTAEKMRKRVGYVPQREGIDWNFPLSVREVVMMGRYGHMGLFRRPKPEDKALVEDAIEAVGLQPYAHTSIGALSGGQQQRVLLARALAQQADLYLMDEPFSGVDTNTERLLFALLKRMCKENKTVVVVFHNVQTATSHFDWLVLLHRRLVAAGPTEEVFTEELLAKVYSAELSILSEVRQQVEKKGIPKHD